MEERRLLQSWKEIAAFLDCSLRTCHRWEEGLDLPVHRLDGTPKARVFAYADELDRWLKEKLNHLEAEEKREAVSRGFRRKKLLLAEVGLAALAAVVLGAAVLWPLLASAPGPGMPHNPSLAVLPFDNLTKDRGLEPWRTAMADLIITDLVQSRYVNVVRITDLYRKLIELKLGDADAFSEEAVRTVAEKAGVDFVATGNLSREGQDVVLTILVHNPKSNVGTRSLRATYREEGDVFSVADELTKKIKLALNLTPRHVSRDIDRAVAGISTVSSQAFKLYSQGYRLAGIARYPESIALFQRAVDIDPQFAMAYRYLHQACLNVGRVDDDKRYVQKALDLSGRLSERERDELEYAYYGDFDKNPSKQLAALKRWWRDYPQDRFASRSLLDLYGGLEDWDKARGVAEAAWGANPSDSAILWWLMISYLNVGWGERAVKLLDDFIDANQRNPYLQTAKVYRTKCYLQLDKLDEALAEAKGLVTERPNDPAALILKGRVHLQRREFPAAAAEFQKMFGRDDPYYQTEALLLSSDLCLMQGRVEEAKGYLKRGLEIANKVESSKVRAIFQRKLALHQELSHLYQISGSLEDALKEIDEAIQCYEQFDRETPPLIYLHQKALVLLEMDRMEDFARLTDEIKQLIERRQKPKLMKIYYHLLGSRELKKNDLKKAAEYFWKAVDLLSVPGAILDGVDPRYFYSLAEALRGDGSGAAFGMYEKVTMPTVNRLHNGDLYAMSFYRMAKAFDDAGPSLVRQRTDSNTARAAYYYRRFLALWGGADPVFAPVVEDVKKRLAALESR
jgi:tetratricopeptide (TPR) repeat protein